MLQHQDTVVGLFGDRECARDAIVALKDAGFAAEDISLLMPDRGAAQDLATDTGTHAGDGAATGAGVGGIAGALVGMGIPEDESRDRGWDEVQPELRQEWESGYPDRPWDRAADALRDAWERVTEPGRRH